MVLNDHTSTHLLAATGCIKSLLQLLLELQGVEGQIRRVFKVYGTAQAVSNAIPCLIGTQRTLPSAISCVSGASGPAGDHTPQSLTTG